MKSILEAGDLNNKRVLVRVDWNVPIEDGVVLDDYRIKQSMPTLEYLNKTGAKVILATHLEPEGVSVDILRSYVPEGMELLENLRNNPGEKSNSEEFAKSLAEKADVYVNEAFSASHRNHTSIVGLPKFLPSYAGISFTKEVEELSKAFNPSHPFLFILGGAKFETKLPIIEKFLNLADSIFIGGTLAKVAKVGSLGKNPKVIFPIGDIEALDSNDETLAMLKDKINESEFILWNGPLGDYEHGYTEGTFNLASLIAESGKTSIVGGGDTLAAIKKLNIIDKLTFVSTGGGAMIDFLAQGTLPGIEALKN